MASWTRTAMGTWGSAASSSRSSAVSAAPIRTASHSAPMRRRCARSARIVAQAQFAHEPERFLAAPKGAIERCLERAGWVIGDVDLFEVNEAFSGIECVRRELDIPEAKFNVNGGAVALGHPIGASGTRLLVTLLYALRARGKRRGVASLCLGGGEAVALAVEMA